MKFTASKVPKHLRKCVLTRYERSLFHAPSLRQDPICNGSQWKEKCIFKLFCRYHSSAARLGGIHAKKIPFCMHSPWMREIFPWLLFLHLLCCVHRLGSKQRVESLVQREFPRLSLKILCCCPPCLGQSKKFGISAPPSFKNIQVQP